jgi:hypothetical protein
MIAGAFRQTEWFHTEEAGGPEEPAAILWFLCVRILFRVIRNAQSMAA